MAVKTIQSHHRPRMVYGVPVWYVSPNLFQEVPPLNIDIDAAH